MGKFEQIPTPGEATEQEERKEQKLWKKTEKIADGNIDAGTSKNEEWWEKVETDKELADELSEKKAKERSDEIVKSPETWDQLNQLKQLWKKYENRELKDEPKKQYEDLITKIKTELDRDVPRVVEMNKELNDYYNKHPEALEEEVNKTLNNPETKKDVLMVNNVIRGRKHLKPESQGKLDTVINTETNKLDEETKSVLGMNKEII